MRTRYAVVALLSGLVLFAGRAVPAWADDKDDIKKADKVVRNRLKELKGDSAKVENLAGEPLTQALPELRFFSARFPLYPVARRPPEGLKSQNLFAVDADGKLKQINDAKGLEEFLRKTLKPVKKDEQFK